MVLCWLGDMPRFDEDTAANRLWRQVQPGFSSVEQHHRSTGVYLLRRYAAACTQKVDLWCLIVHIAKSLGINIGPGKQ